MKKSLIIFSIFILLLTACSQDITRVSLNDLSDNYSLDDAKSDNCVTFEDGDITYGQSVWDTFTKKTLNSKPATVRLGFYYTLGDPSRYSKELYEKIKDNYPILYINDLSFDGKKYIIESIEDGKLTSKEYKYLMKYNGHPRSTSALFSEYTYYVLVNDNNVTWDDIEHGMLSSQSGAYIDHYRVYSDLIMN